MFINKYIKKILKSCAHSKNIKAFNKFQSKYIGLSNFYKKTIANCLNSHKQCVYVCKKKRNNNKAIYDFRKHINRKQQKVRNT